MTGQARESFRIVGFLRTPLIQYIVKINRNDQVSRPDAFGTVLTYRASHYPTLVERWHGTVKWQHELELVQRNTAPVHTTLKSREWNLRFLLACRRSSILDTVLIIALTWFLYSRVICICTRTIDGRASGSTVPYVVLVEICCSERWTHQCPNSRIIFRELPPLLLGAFSPQGASTDDGFAGAAEAFRATHADVVGSVSVE